jgi:MerR family copper efflux transcriptional regulator
MHVNIGEAARAAGMPPKTIRYYEDIGLVRSMRSENGYRVYDEAGVRKLQFLSRARRLGFTLEDCRVLLSLYEDQERSSADVREIALRHLAEVDRMIRELRGLRAAIADLVASCQGDHRPDCPILDDLAGTEPA